MVPFYELFYILHLKNFKFVTLVWVKYKFYGKFGKVLKLQCLQARTGRKRSFSDQSNASATKVLPIIMAMLFCQLQWEWNFCKKLMLFANSRINYCIKSHFHEFNSRRVVNWIIVCQTSRAFLCPKCVYESESHFFSMKGNASEDKSF